MKVNKQSASKSSFAQMVAGLPHHLNNPLAAILGYSELLLRRDLDASAKGMVELIHQQAERCKHTLQSLNAMTRRPSQGFQAIDLSALAQECVALKASESELHQVQVNLDFPAGGLSVRADPIALQQVLFHLFDNALQALDQQSGDRIVSISGFNSNGWAVVQVKDSGGGIRPDVLPRVFEPFYTTKSKEQNPGLGLTVCLAIVQEHEGRIEVESTEGHGTCVKLFLPDKAKPADTASNISKVLAGKRILVAEDEPALAQLLNSLLTPLKAHVVHVNDGLEALRSARQGQWDLIISDIQMPGMTGIELHQSLASGDSTLADRMILITGSTWAQRETLLPKSNVQLLYKPFSRNELLEAISRAIAEPPPEERST